MINRKLADVIKGQKLVALAERETMQKACRYMKLIGLEGAPCGHTASGRVARPVRYP